MNSKDRKLTFLTRKSIVKITKSGRLRDSVKQNSKNLAPNLRKPLTSWKVRFRNYGTVSKKNLSRHYSNRSKN